MELATSNIPLFPIFPDTWGGDLRLWSWFPMFILFPLVVVQTLGCELPFSTVTYYFVLVVREKPYLNIAFPSTLRTYRDSIREHSRRGRK